MVNLRRVPVSVLDTASVSFGMSNADALRASVELARSAESLGFDRFWVAEHHGMAAVASSAPAVLISAIASVTERIRVGSGGVMLPNHPPLVVAEQFGMLSALFDGRIDLGIGRAPGTDGPTAMALRRSEAGLSAEDFPQQLLDLMAFFDGRFEAGNPLAGIRAVPGLGNRPEMWLLGSSGFSAQVAAALGLPFSFAHHFSGDDTEAALDLYRSRFTPSDVLSEPHTMVSINVVSEEDPEELRAQSLPSALMFLRMRQGLKPQAISREEALAHEISTLEQQFIDARTRRQAVGDAAHVEAQIAALLESTRADELIVTSGAADPDARRRSLEVVAKLFAL
jgi:luciferase family oxidoreductase group 1